MNTLLLDAIANKNKRRPPIWLMRQAGRYMPQYLALRKKQSLFDMFHDVEKVIEVTLLPIQLLNVDAAILFSDILSVCDGLGVKWGFVEGKGPVIEKLVTPDWKFQKPNYSYEHIVKAISSLKKELKVPLLGFAGAPFTVASYLVGGEKKAKQWMYSDAKSFEKLLDIICEETISYLKIQVQAGVNAVQLFDSWAGLLDSSSFRKYSLHYMGKIVQALKNTPVILFCKGSCFYAEEIASLKPACVSCDWSGELYTLRKKISLPLQGNMDPMILLGSQAIIIEKAQTLLASMKNDPGYIFNLGHGILPETPFENVRTLVDYVLAQ